MNTLMTLDPWRFLDEVLDTGSKAFTRIRARAAGRFPPVNVYLDDDAVIIDLELPGKTAKEVELSLEPQAIVIADSSSVAAEGAKDDKPATETNQSSFAKATEDNSAMPSWSRRLELPFRVNADKANAKFTNGILRIELPKAEATGVKKITIEG